MKIKSILTSVISAAFFLTACSTPAPTTTAGASTPAPTTGEKPSFVFVVTDQLGDKSFNDSAAKGTEKITKDLGYETKIMEIGRDQTKWEPTILDLSESGKYTAIFLNGSGTKEIVEKIAKDFPKQKYVLFDAEIDKGSNDNVYAISYKQNEGSYLGGVVAGLVTASKMPNANADHKIGFIGGDAGPII
ncbi:MAG: BMP family ABC transporter substrate-binding protein, partial [Clostridiaceae bacterium]